MAWGEREAILFRKLGDALQSGETVIRLDETDYQDLQDKYLPELPDALSVNVTLLTASPAHVDRGDFKLLWQGAFGPSGALYLGRFCHGDASLYDWVKRHLAREEDQRPDPIFAKIVHRPQDRLGNVICRPNLRSYEIPYHGRSGVEDNRQIPPGNEWLYVKVYTGPAGANKILQSAVSPIITSALNDGRVDRWFFLRYADPETHLRIRMHGNPGALREEVWPALEKQLKRFLDNGTVWRVTPDTYDREIERYGGDAGIALAEAVFHADSDAAIKMLKLSEQDDGIRNWQLALLSVHSLLDDLGIDLEDRSRQLGAMCSGLKTDLDSAFGSALNLNIHFHMLLLSTSILNARLWRCPTPIG